MQYINTPQFQRSGLIILAYEPVNHSNDLSRIIIEIQYNADMNFYQRLIYYSRSLSRQYNASTPPIFVAVVINSTTRELLETEIPGSRIPYAKLLSSIGWVRSYILLNAETIAPHLNETPLNPFFTLVHCLIEQNAPFINFSESNDPTLITLYTKMKNILGEHIHVFKSVYAQPKAECYKGKCSL